MTKKNRYRFIGPYLLMDHAYIEITHDKSKTVTFHSDLHKPRDRPFRVSYSMEFSDSEILRDPDLLNTYIEMYGDLNFKTHTVPIKLYET